MKTEEAFGVVLEV